MRMIDNAESSAGSLMERFGRDPGAGMDLATSTSLQRGSGSTAPTPSNPLLDVPAPRPGLLTVCVSGARGLSLPSGESVPPLIQHALGTQQAKIASSVTLQSVSHGHQPAQNSEKRESLQRKQYWWLPYIILEFDKEEILIGSVGGTIQEPVWMFRAHFDVCRVSEITLQVYLHIGTKIKQLANDKYGQSDLFMARLKFVPDFDRRGTVYRWYDVSDGSGQVNVAVTFKASTNLKQSLSVDNFDLLKVIGKGYYGRVLQVRKKDTSRVYALKSIRKAHLALRNEITHTLAERTVLAKVNSPFIVPLKFSFQTPAKLYLLFPFYAGELLLALEHLHGLNIVYGSVKSSSNYFIYAHKAIRDLKVENILLDYSGHIAIGDFGLCKFKMPDQDTPDTSLGLEYLAPEVLLGHGYSKTADWWNLGQFLYEMLTGLPPFYDENQYEMYRKILQDPLRFGDEVGLEARSLLNALLTRDPSQRLGVNGAEEIKRHPFFSQYIDFEKLLAKKIQPPVAGALNTSDFDQFFTPEQSLDGFVADLGFLESVQAQFT
ncbi:hypothetical protein FRC00_005692, partial [Tulasnella sp. 408]